MRKSWEEYWYDLALATAGRGTCPRRQVGAVLVKDNELMATGYNGSPSGQDHCEDVGCDIEHDHCVRTIHAEINVLIRSTREQQQGSVLYVTDFPCFRCAQAIANSGITYIKYVRNYRMSDRAVEVLRQARINYEIDIRGRK